MNNVSLIGRLTKDPDLRYLHQACGGNIQPSRTT